MNEQFKAFWVGLFILAAVVVIAWFLLFLRPNVGDGELVLKIRFSNIEKISVGTRVTFAGKAVGEVVEINQVFDARELPTDRDGNPYFYELVCRVDSHVKIFSSDHVLFSTSGLLGEKTIAIVPRVPPKGSPQPKEVTTDVLYANSQDKMQELIDKLNCVTVTLDKTLNKVNGFIDLNSEPFHAVILDAGRTFKKVEIVADQFNQSRVIGDFSDVLTQIKSGRGSFGRLIYNDALYSQLHRTLFHADQVFEDIEQYGLFFQFNSNWRRKHRQQMREENLLGVDYLNREFEKIEISLDRVRSGIEQMKVCEPQISNECFAEKFSELLNKIEDVEKSLQIESQPCECVPVWN